MSEDGSQHIDSLERYPNVFVREAEGASSEKDEPEKDEKSNELEGGWINEIYQKGYNAGWEACEEQYQAEVTQIKEQWEEETNAIRSSAEEERKQLEQKIESLEEELAGALSEYFESLEKQAREELCDLAFEFARIIVDVKAEDKDVARGAIDEIFSRLTDFRGTKLYLHPENVERFSDGSVVPRGVEILEDASMGLGDAVVECGQGILDASVGSRIQELKETLRSRLLQKENGSESEDASAENVAAEG